MPPTKVTSARDHCHVERHLRQPDSHLAAGAPVGGERGQRRQHWRRLQPVPIHCILLYYFVLIWRTATRRHSLRLPHAGDECLAARQHNGPALRWMLHLLNPLPTLPWRCSASRCWGRLRRPGRANRSPCSGAETRGLLYCLAAELQPVARTQLCYLFWPDIPDQRRGNLSRLLVLLRNALPHPSCCAPRTRALRAWTGSTPGAHFRIWGLDSLTGAARRAARRSRSLARALSGWVCPARLPGVRGLDGTGAAHLGAALA